MHKSIKCLMIETKDHRKFFTQEKNLPQLIEFSKTFEAELSIVSLDPKPDNPRCEEVEILDLSKLVPALCDYNYKIKNPEIEILERKTPNKYNRTKTIKNANKIRKYIGDQLLSGQPLKLADVAKKFKRYKLTLACFCQHSRAVREELQLAGIKIDKIGAGEYIIK